MDQALLRAKSLAKKGKIEEARKLYQVVLQAFPKNKRAQQGLTTLSGPIPTVDVQGPPQEVINQLINFYNQGQLAVVVEQATALTEQYPEAFVVWNLLGASAAQTGQSNKAIFAFQRVIAIKPDYAEAYYNMGKVLQEQGKFDEAIASYNKALSLKPDYADAYNNMGNVLQDQGKLDEAIEAYNKALAIKPDYADACSNTVELLKMISPKSTKAHVAFQMDKKVKEIGNSLLASNSDKEIALKLSQALECISQGRLNYKTSLSQIYKRNSIDLNCSRHTEIFNSKDVIPEFCFGCFKVQVEVNNLFSLIRLTRQFYDLEPKADITRKTMIEMRPEIPGFYKGLLYCRGLDQAREVKELLDIKLKDIFAGKIISQIKRGCSEFPLKFPDYGKIIDNKITPMDYPTKWKVVEEQFDENSSLKPKENITPSISGFCLSDFYIIQKWIDYAKGLDDPSCKEFEKHPIVFRDVFDIAVLRKAKYGALFKQKN